MLYIVQSNEVARVGLVVVNVVFSLISYLCKSFSKLFEKNLGPFLYFRYLIIFL